MGFCLASTATRPQARLEVTIWWRRFRVLHFTALIPRSEMKMRTQAYWILRFTERRRERLANWTFDLLISGSVGTEEMFSKRREVLIWHCQISAGQACERNSRGERGVTATYRHNLVYQGSKESGFLCPCNIACPRRTRLRADCGVLERKWTA